MRFGKYEVDERQHPIAIEGGGEGVQCLIFFPNGFGASIVRFKIRSFFSSEPAGSYGIKHGLWEMAVLKGNKEDGWSLTYDTPITDDVIGYLSEKEVSEYLEQIEALPHSSTQKVSNE